MSITKTMPCPSGLCRDLFPVLLLLFQLVLPETGGARSAGRFPAPDRDLKIACNSLNLLKAEKRSHGYSFDNRYWEVRRDPCPNCPDPDKRRLAIMIAKRQGGSAQEYYDKLTDPDFVKKRVEDNVAGLVSIGSLLIPLPKIFGWGSNVAKRSSSLAKFSSILRDAAKFKGNFGLGKGTASEALELGRAWVGKGYMVASDGKTLLSKNGLRQFRPPSFKPNLGIQQANFEWRNVAKGAWQGNGHLDIIK